MALRTMFWKWRGTQEHHCQLVQPLDGKLLCRGVQELVQQYEKYFEVNGDYVEMWSKFVEN